MERSYYLHVGIHKKVVCDFIYYGFNFIIQCKLGGEYSDRRMILKSYGGLDVDFHC